MVADWVETMGGPVRKTTGETPLLARDEAMSEDLSKLKSILLGADIGLGDLLVGADLDSGVRLLLGTEDFLEIRRQLVDRRALAPGRFKGVPPAATKQWIGVSLPVSADTRTAIALAKTWRALLLALLVDPYFLVLDPKRRSSPNLAIAAPLEANDVVHAYNLLFGRAPVDGEIAGRVGQSFAPFLGDLFGSDEFRQRCVEPLFSGGFWRSTTSAPPAMVRWTIARFGLFPALDSPVAELLASLIQTPFVETILSLSPKLNWEPASVAELLRAPSRSAPDDPSAPVDAITRLGALCRGLEVVTLQNIELGSSLHFRMCSTDPAIIFRLEPDLAENAVATEITFTVGGARRRASGVIYIDYGEGFSETQKLLLWPRGRRRYGALLVNPARIKAIRWDPDDAEGEIIIASIVARPVADDELAVKMAAIASSVLLKELVNGPALREPAVFLDFSKQLTRELYGHEDQVQGDYQAWIEQNELPLAEAATLWRERLDRLTVSPKISILVPVYETPALLLREMIESVLAQVYPNWELCLADDASLSPHVREIIEDYAEQDARIKAVFRPVNGHISHASNSALELASGEWTALLDHDDLLTPDALLWVAAEIEAWPDAQFIYSDEDKLNDKGQRYDPFFKPDFSPELLRAQNYLNHLSVHRTANIREVGGWRPGFEGSQDYDLNLRTLERLEPAAVRHIPKVLYHWRAVTGSTALSLDQKNYAFQAGMKALEEHIQRLGWQAEAMSVESLPFYRVRYALPSPPPRVSVIVPTRDYAHLVEMCIDSVIERTEYDNYEILIVDNGSVEPETFRLFDRLTKDPRVRIVKQPGPFNYSRINNAAVAVSTGEIVCLLNNDIEVITPDWMREMASWAAQPRIGCVGAKLYYPNDTIQHAGVVLGIGGVAGHSHKYRARSDTGYFARLALSHDVSAVTAACLFVRREIYDAQGGLDESLAVAFNDVDFCLRVREAGYHNVFTPFAELYHHESVSRGVEDNPEKQRRFALEIARMQERWGKTLVADPYYSPNLSMKKEDYSFD